MNSISGTEQPEWGDSSPELGDLIALTRLNLGWNQLSGTVPTELGNLISLTRLDLGGNELSGTIPTALGNLTALTSLTLGNNQLSGTVPPDLGDLTNLDELYLSDNRLRGCLPAVWQYVVENDLDQHWSAILRCGPVDHNPLPLSRTETSWPRFIGLRMATTG